MEVADRLKNGSKGTARAGRHRLRRALVVAEVALTMAVAGGAGLFLQSLHRLTHVNPGFDASRIIIRNRLMRGRGDRQDDRTGLRRALRKM